MLSNIPRSNVSRNGEPLQWTLSFDDCLRVFEEQKESINDTLLVQLVKLRLITGKIMDAPGTGPSDTHFPRPSAPIYLQSFQKQIREFRSQIPPELTDNSKLLTPVEYPANGPQRSCKWSCTAQK